MTYMDGMSLEDLKALVRYKNKAIDWLLYFGIAMFVLGAIGWVLWGWTELNQMKSSSSNSEGALADLVRNSGAAIRMTCSGEGVVFDGVNLTANKSTCEVVIGKTAPGGSEVKVITG